MTFVVLFILAVVWAVYLVSWFRSRTVHTGGNSISTFSNHLSILERTAPGANPSTYRNQVVSRTPKLSSQKKRRRDILVGLLGATGATFLGTIAIGGMVTNLFLLCLVLTASYVGLLATAQKQALERRTKVRYLDEAAPVAEWATSADEFLDEDAEAYPARRFYAVNGN
ncbi:MAG: hypothetical protein F2585_09450 [Actinobacteria bacterium]|nr:hypothetical protein [Actinomycetota bacterium]